MKTNKYLEHIKYQNEQDYIIEGIDIDFVKKQIYFNDNHEKNINTSIFTNPSISYMDEIEVISIFKRKRNSENKTDGNPLVYALKNLNDWKIDKNEILKLLKRFKEIVQKINDKYDTIICVPSSNVLNNQILHQLNKIIGCEYKITEYMQKMDADDVYDSYVDWEGLHNDFPRRDFEKSINDSFLRMEKENNNIFSFKYILPEYRVYIKKTMIKNYSIIKYANEINDRDILILDDTISSGNTISEMCKDIISTYTPKSLTVITLFSSL